MYMIKGLIRSTILYLALVSLIKESSFQMLLLYVAVIIIHIVFSRFKKERFSIGEMIFNIIIHDIIAPILGIRSLAKLLLKKYLDGPNEPHAEVFLAQGITEAVWSVLLLGYLAINVL